MKYIRGVVLAGALLLLPGLTSAQPPTPELELAAPGPDQCTIAPISPDRLAMFRASGTAEASPVVPIETPNTEAATPTPFVAPEGTPVDSETAAEVEPIVVEYYACQNANDQLRLLSLYSDRYLAEIIGQGQIDPQALERVATPQPVRLASEQLWMAVNGVIEIETDVYGIDVVGLDQSTAQPFTDYLIVVRNGDTFQIDEVSRLS